MSIADRLKKEIAVETERRMGPAVEAMGRLERKIDELIRAVNENTKAVREKK